MEVALPDKPTIKFQSSDGEIFIIELEIARQIEFIKNMIEDLCEDNLVIPLPNLNSTILKLLIEWHTYHKDDKEPPVENEYDFNEKRRELSDWDKNFAKQLDIKTLCDLMNSTGDIYAPKLRETLAIFICEDKLEGKTPEEIRKIFNIKYDFKSKEQEEGHEPCPLTEDEESSDDEPAAPDILPAAPDILPAAPDILPAAPDILPAAPDILPAAPDILPAAPDILPAAPDIFSGTNATPTALDVAETINVPAAPDIFSKTNAAPVLLNVAAVINTTPAMPDIVPVALNIVPVPVALNIVPVPVAPDILPEKIDVKI